MKSVAFSYGSFYKILPGKLICFFLFAGMFHANAQRPHESIWLTANVPVQFASKWEWHNDGGYRTLGMKVAASQFFYRTGIRYIRNKNLSTAAGVAFFFTRTSFERNNHEFGKEFRLWEEVNVKSQLYAKLQWQNRLRIEQRFFSETNRKDAYNAYRFRFRTSFTQMLSGKFSLLVANEYMRQCVGRQFNFDQNRLMINGIFKCSTSMQVQSGYMWLIWPAHSNQHVFVLTLQKNGSLYGNRTRK